jgi:hypothetical protein
MVAAMKGSCACGNVTFEAINLRSSVVFCHCTQCRKWSGHYWSSTATQESDVTINGEVRWYRSSDRAERGFCPTCGSALFFRPTGSGRFGVSMGALDQPTSFAPLKHIFCAEKGDYYDLPEDGVPHVPD